MVRSAKLVLQSAGDDADEEMQLLAVDSDDSEEQTVPSQLSSLPHRAAGAFGVACLLCVAIFAALGSRQGAEGTASPPTLAAHRLTVRSLLESADLANIVVDNLVAMGGESLAHESKETVRVHVAHSLQGISEEIRRQHPEEHRKLEALEVSDAQKGVVLNRLRRFGDPRMIGLTRDVADVVRESVNERGDHEALKRRLTEKLQAKLGDLQQLSQEMPPASMSTASKIGSWDAQFEVDLGSESARRLLAGDDIDAGVRVHAQSLFESLHSELGERMPTAPARGLSFFGSDDDEDGSSSKKDSGFMSCVVKAVPSPPKVCKCIADNMSEVMSLVMNFLGGKGKN